jgi:hypothetical protein
MFIEVMPHQEGIDELLKTNEANKEVTEEPVIIEAVVIETDTLTNNNDSTVLDEETEEVIE